MTTTTENPRRPAGIRAEFLRGARSGIPFLLVVLPFAILFGVVATEAGLPLLQVMGFSVLLIAGASQFAALQLMADQAPTLVVLATALAVNLRMAMYSAALVPYLGAAPLWKRAIASYFLVDQSFAASLAEFEARPAMPLRARLAFFFGTIVPVAPFWYLGTLIGALLGSRVPEALALDFALPVLFLALVAPMLKTFAHVAAAATSIVVALLAAGMPLNLGLIVAALCAMAAGAGTEMLLERRHAP